MKVKVNKKIQEQVKLFEADAQAAPAAPAASPSSVDDEIKALCGKQAAANNLIFSVKLPGELFSNVPFPKVGPQYATLMQDMGNAKKWKNLRGMVPDPTATVDSAPDAAYEAFNGLTALDLSQVASEGSANESLEVDGDELNESIFDHMLTGGITWFKHDKDIAKTKKTNKKWAAGKDEDDDDEDEEENTNNEEDREKLQKQAREYDAAINNYISALITNTQDLLMLINGKGSADSVKQFSKLVLAFKNHTVERVTDYIKSQDEIIQKAKQEYENERVNRSEKQASNANRRSEAYSLLMKNYAKLTPDKRAAAAGALKNANSYESVKKAMSDAGLLSQWEGAEESMNYNYNHTLNEETIVPDGTKEIQEQPELKIGDKTISEYYSSVKDQLEQKIEEITATANAKDSQEYTDAKQQMETLKKFADETIAKRIDIVCKTGSNAGGEQQGVGQKILAFLSKHPLRAEKLKTCWATHAQDLNDRMKQKLDMIASAKSGTALGFCKEIANQTIPELFARMLTYKAILVALQQHNIYKTNDPIQIKKMSDEAATDNLANDIRSSIALALADNGALISEDTTSVFTIDNDGNLQFNKAKAKYTGLLVYAIYNSNKKPINFESLESDIAALNNCQDGNAFVDEIISILLKQNPNILTTQSLGDILSGVPSDKATYASVMQSLNNLNNALADGKTNAQIKWCLACLYSHPNVAAEYMETSTAEDAEDMNNNTEAVQDSVNYNYTSKLFEANDESENASDDEKIQPKDADIEKANGQLDKFNFDANADTIYSILNAYETLNINSLKKEDKIVPNEGKELEDKVNSVKNVAAILLSKKLQDTMSDKQQNIDSKKELAELSQGYSSLDKNTLDDFMTLINIDGKTVNNGASMEELDPEKIIDKFKELAEANIKLDDKLKECDIHNIADTQFVTIFGEDGLLGSKANIDNADDITIGNGTSAEALRSFIDELKKALAQQFTDAVKATADDPMTKYKEGLANLKQMIADAKNASEMTQKKIDSLSDEDKDKDAKDTYNKLKDRFDAIVKMQDLDSTLADLLNAPDDQMKEKANALSDKAKEQLATFDAIENIKLPTWQSVAQLMYGKKA